MMSEDVLSGKRVKVTTTVREGLVKWCKENRMQISRLIEIGFREFQKMKVENQHIRELYDKIGKLEKRVSFLERKLLIEGGNHDTDK